MNTAKAVDVVQSETTAKEEVEELLRNLPDDCTLEDIQDHLEVLMKVKEGERALAAGEKYTLEQARELLQQWLTP